MVAIRHPKDPTRPTVLPDGHYNPDAHTLWDDSDARPYGRSDSERADTPPAPTGPGSED